MTRTRQIALAAAALVVAVGLVAAHQTASAAIATREPAAVALAAKINVERARADLALLSVDPALTAVAQQWAEQLASHGELAHRDRLGAEAWAAGARFANIGENVGVGDDVDALHAAFMASPTHQANVMEPTWTRVGVGVATGGDGQLWVAVNFADPAPAGQPAP